MEMMISLQTHASMRRMGLHRGLLAPFNRRVVSMNNLRAEAPCSLVSGSSSSQPPGMSVASNDTWIAGSSVTARTADLLQRLFRRFDGCVAVRLWDGSSRRLGAHAMQELRAPFTLVLNHPGVLRMLLLGRDPLRWADAYFRGDIEVEGDFFAALRMKDYLSELRLSARDALAAMFSLLRLPHGGGQTLGLMPRYAREVRLHSRAENNGAIQFHYDVSNDFYAQWLDESMVYSCAYFEHADDSLQTAQSAKLDHICRKLMLKPGDSFLDVGCGWGALTIHAARHYGVMAHGITLSRQQYALAQQRIADAGLRMVASVELLDYRDLPATRLYDKVASVGMFEHVGLNNLPLYFASIVRVLKPGGLFLNHGITHDVEGWKETPYTRFINRYVFPDGQLDTISNIQRRMEHEGFEIADVEALRSHYALTLRHWVARLEANHDEVLRHVSESTFRVWRLYMAACALDFESGCTGIYQVLASKRAARGSVLPLTRRHLYPPLLREEQVAASIRSTPQRSSS